MVWFDPRIAAYYRDGKLVGDDDLKRIIFLFLNLLADELEDLAIQASEGAISLQELQHGSMQIIKSGYIASGLLGAGQGLTHRQQGLVEADTRSGFTFLETFVRKIEERTMLRARSVQMIAKRIRSYARAGNPIFERSRRDAALAAADPATGAATYTQERNVLGRAEHCVECVEETGRGWVEIGSLSLPGTRICRVNCRCRLVFR